MLVLREGIQRISFLVVGPLREGGGYQPLSIKKKYTFVRKKTLFCLCIFPKGSRTMMLKQRTASVPRCVKATPCFRAMMC